MDYHEFNSDQQDVIDEINHIIRNESEFLVYLNAPAGTGKTSVMKHIIRSNPKETYHVISLAAVAAIRYSDALHFSETVTIPGMEIEDPDNPGSRITRPETTHTITHDCGKAQSVFGNLCSHDFDLTNEIKQEWEGIYTEMKEGSYIPALDIPDVDVDNTEEVEVFLKEFGKLDVVVKDKTKKGQITPYQWLTANVMITAYEEWQDKYADKPERDGPILIVEEFSMVSILSLFAHMYSKIIFVGDRNQLPAIEGLPPRSDSYIPRLKEVIDRAHECHAELAKDFARKKKELGVHTFYLQKNERDPEHQEFYDWLLDCMVPGNKEQRPSPYVDGVISRIYASVPKDLETLPVRVDETYLCDTNDMRQFVETKYHQLFRDSVIKLPPKIGKMESKQVDLMFNHTATKGLIRYFGADPKAIDTTEQLAELIGDYYMRYCANVIVGGSVMVTKNTPSLNVYNGEVYLLQYVMNDKGEQELVLCDPKKQRYVEVPYMEMLLPWDSKLRVASWMKAMKSAKISVPLFVPAIQEANCITVHKSQGTTLEGKVSVILTSECMMSKQILYTAATRCSNVEQLTIYTNRRFDQQMRTAKFAPLSIEDRVMDQENHNLQRAATCSQNVSSQPVAITSIQARFQQRRQRIVQPLRITD